MICSHCGQTNVYEVNVSVNSTYIEPSPDPDPKNIEYTGESEYGDFSDWLYFECGDCGGTTFPMSLFATGDRLLGWALGSKMKAYRCDCTEDTLCAICRVRDGKNELEDMDPEFLFDADELA